ncbi:MAG: hypothetical protein ACFWTZ_07090 [Burkholderia sp.]|jgi:hypothetical protein
MTDLTRFIRSFLPGRARLRHPALRGIAPEEAAELEAFLASFKGVTKAEVSPRTGSVLLFWDEAQTSGRALLNELGAFADMMFGGQAPLPREGVHRTRSPAVRAAAAVDRGAGDIFARAASVLMPEASKRAPRRAGIVLENRVLLASLAASVGSLALRRSPALHAGLGALYLALLSLHLLRHRRVL